MVSSLQTQFQQIMTYHYDIPTKNCLVLDACWIENWRAWLFEPLLKHTRKPSG